jgi:hypothetical protein
MKLLFSTFRGGPPTPRLNKSSTPNLASDARTWRFCRTPRTARSRQVPCPERDELRMPAPGTRNDPLYLVSKERAYWRIGLGRLSPFQGEVAESALARGREIVYFYDFAGHIENKRIRTKTGRNIITNKLPRSPNSHKEKKTPPIRRINNAVIPHNNKITVGRGSSILSIDIIINYILNIMNLFLGRISGSSS